MALTSKARIIVKGADDVRYVEGTATEAITPGMLVEFVTASTIQKNDSVVGASAAYNGPVIVAVENSQEGGGIDDAYASGDQVLAAILDDEQAYLWVAAGSAAITYGTLLKTAAGGYVITGDVTNAVAIAREAVDASASGVDLRILCDIV